MWSCRFNQAFHCDRCARTFSADERSVDLTSTSGASARVYKQSFWGGTQIFRCAMGIRFMLISALRHLPVFLLCQGMCTGASGVLWCLLPTNVAGGEASHGQDFLVRRGSSRWRWITCDLHMARWGKLYYQSKCPETVLHACCRLQWVSDYCRCWWT